jgi:uncharacterized protein YggE
MMLSLFLVVETISQLKAFNFIGKSDATQNVITVNGKGELFVEPDTAIFSFSVREEGAVVKDAQTKATEKANKAIEFLTASGVDKKDIKSSYSIYPRYEYRAKTDPRTGIYMPQGERYLAAYEVTQSFNVKVRDIKDGKNDLGKVLTGLGSLAVSDVSSLSFVNDKEDELRKSARATAIADAQKDAESLARSLGVSLVRVVNFNESGNYPGPVFYRAAGLESKAMDASATPDITPGENKITSNVTITYEIR